MKATVSCEGVQVLSDELTRAEAEGYCRYAVRERQKVDGFRGATWNAPIGSTSAARTASAGPSYQLISAIEAFSRCRCGEHGRTPEDSCTRSSTFYAPSNNRFLAEGLAVYLHARLAGNPAFPNLGEDLRRLALQDVSTGKSLEALNSVRTPRPLSTVMAERTAYILAGSFVGFLVERYGLALFRRVYETEDYDKAYGKSFGTLEREWRSSLLE